MSQGEFSLGDSQEIRGFQLSNKWQEFTHEGIRIQARWAGKEILTKFGRILRRFSPQSPGAAGNLRYYFGTDAKGATKHVRAKAGEEDKVLRAYCEELKEMRPHAPKRRRWEEPTEAAATERKYFNPFEIDWRSTKEFFQIPEWVVRAPISELEKIVYARLLFPLPLKKYPENGFCKYFAPEDPGTIFDLSYTLLARCMGKKEDRTTGKAVQRLGEAGLIEIIGGQGQKKTIRFLRSRWMSQTWLRLSDPPSDKLADPPFATSDKSADPPRPTSEKLPEVTSCKTNRNESPKNESVRASTTPPDAVKIRAKSRGKTDAEKRAAGEFSQPADAFTDTRWSALAAAVGKTEMENCGDRWRKRFLFCRETINTITIDFAMAGGTDGKIQNPAGWFEKAWSKSAAGRRLSSKC